MPFAKVLPGQQHLFHKDTNNLWPNLAKLKPAQAKALLKLCLIELIEKDALFTFCINVQLLDTLINVAFEPGDMFSPNLHSGVLEVLFVPRKFKEIKSLHHQTNLNKRAIFVTTEDTNQTKFGLWLRTSIKDASILLLAPAIDISSLFSLFLVVRAR